MKIVKLQKLVESFHKLELLDIRRILIQELPKGIAKLLYLRYQEMTRYFKKNNRKISSKVTISHHFHLFLSFKYI